MAAAPNHAAIRSLPDQLGVMRETVVAHAPRGPVFDHIRGLLLAWLFGAELCARALAALVPLPGPVTAHVPEAGTLGGWPPPDGWPQSDADEPLVPRRPAGGHPQAPFLPG